MPVPQSYSIRKLNGEYLVDSASNTDRSDSLTKSTKRCPRCHGTGIIKIYKHIQSGICFLCDGSMSVSTGIYDAFKTKQPSPIIDTKQKNKELEASLKWVTFTVNDEVTEYSLNLLLRKLVSLDHLINDFYCKNSSIEKVKVNVGTGKFQSLLRKSEVFTSKIKNIL